MNDPPPCRLRRSRARGWRMPPGAIYVGRPGVWGNPFQSNDFGAGFRAVAPGLRGDRRGRAEAAVRLHHTWLTGDWTEAKPDGPPLVWWWRQMTTIPVAAPPDHAQMRAALAGHDLACWCPLCPEHAAGKPRGVVCRACAPCHADTLLELANA